MKDKVRTASTLHPDALERRRRVAAKLLEIEGNPVQPSDRCMIEMFDSQGLTAEQRRAHVVSQFARSRVAAE